ncbi:MAG TPA: hypothetical protein VEP66_21420 [Myxococcales bacterium]|nr:hypothetical protein [Myxococcales bacterium]
MRARTNCSPLLLLIAGVLGTACNPSYTGSSTTVSVTVTPQQATLAMSATLSFAAAVSGGSSADVLWSVQEVGGGMIDASGKYTAPAVAGTFHVVAASMADPSSTDNATVTVSASGGISVAVIPRNASVVTGGSLPFTATVSGTSGNQSTAVTWSVQESGGGSINASGQYTAPGSTGTYHVIATSVADTSKKDTATVSVTSTPVIAVSVSPGAVSTLTGGTIPFTATVTGTTTGQSTAVTWSVQESGGGSVSASGVYTAPSSGGTYHVVATSVADTSKKDTATVTVTAPVITVAVSPQATETTPGGSLSFSAAVGGSTTGQSTAVTWSVQEGAAGGTVTSSGGYTAPATSGTYHVVATSVADPSKSGTATVSVTTLTIIPSDRRTTWNPGVLSQGGVPNRTTICATVQASTYGNGASDATAGIQAAINGCPAGQVVLLSAGTFTINNDIIMINKGVTLRGAGAGSTLLQRTNGATPGSYIPGVAKPVIIVGPARWGSGGSAVNLANDAVKGADSVQLAAAPTGGLTAGQIVMIDELSGAGWQTDPGGRGQIWASPDFRVVYQRHNPGLGTDDPFPDAASWFSRPDRVTVEIKEVKSWDAGTKTVSFTSPFHIDYRTSHTAQLYVFNDKHVKNAGVEDLKLKGGDDGQLRFNFAAYSWAARVENTGWLGEGFAINASFRVEVRDSYVHTPVYFEPGGGSYNISLADGSAEILIENNISTDADKVMVARCSGAGSVVGYNYMDDGHIGSNANWVEIGLNASHMVGPHHVLFEGNYGFNFDSDKTHGNSIYHTVFRNHLSGKRLSFNDGGPKRCAGAGFYSYWMTYVGNVLGRSGQMTGWVYEAPDMDTPGIWLLGWDDWNPYPMDAQVKATALRHGNYDYVNNAVTWDPSNSNHTLPQSLYLSQKPAFFSAGSGYVWPWVDPTGTPQLRTLPAKARFDAGTPFTQP